MNPRTRRPLLSVPCASGTLTLFGVTGQVATLVVTDLHVSSIERLARQLKLEFAASSCIVTESFYDAPGTATIIVEQRFDGKIRNPRRFLGSVRRRIRHAIKRAKEEPLAVLQTSVAN